MLVNPETKIFLKVKRKKYRIPVNPSEISITHGTVDKTEQVAGVGEILIPQKPGLMTATWTSFFPSYSGDPYVTGTANPQKIVKALEKAWKKRQSCRLVITRSNGFDTNLKCRISDFKYTDNYNKEQREFRWVYDGKILQLLFSDLQKEGSFITSDKFPPGTEEENLESGGGSVKQHCLCNGRAGAPC